MKEESKKISFLVNRYGLLTVLGLGYSFLGGGAAIATTTVVPPITANARYVAGSDANNVFTVDSSGKVPNTKTSDAYVFRHSQEDKITLDGAADKGVVAQVVFNKTQEAAANPGTGGAGFAPKIKNAAGHFDAAGDVGKEFAAGSDKLAAVLSKITAEKAKAILGGLTPAHVHSGDLNKDVAGGVGVDLGASVGDDDVKRVLHEFNAKSFATKAEIGIWLTAISTGAEDLSGDSSVGANFGVTNGSGNGQYILTKGKLNAIGVELKRLFDASAFWSHANYGNNIVPELEIKLAEVTTIGANLTTGMGAGAWGAGNLAKLERLFAAADASATIASGDKNFLGIINELKTKVNEVKTWLLTAKKANISESVLGDAIKASLPAASGASDAAAAIAFLNAHLDGIIARLDELAAGDGVTGLFNVVPVAATPATTNRSFTVQITADELTKPLNLKNEAGDVMLKIDAKNMVANDNVLVLFDKLDATKALVGDVMGGRTFFLNLSKDINLTFANGIGKDGKLEKTVALESFDDVNTVTGTNGSTIPTHLSLTLVQSAETPLDANSQPTIFAFTFTKAVDVKNLTLGVADKKLKLSSIREGGLAAEADVQSGASVDYKENLVVQGNAVFNAGSYVKAEGKSIVFGGNFTDKGSWLNAGALSFAKGTIDGPSAWSIGGPLTLGQGGLEINGKLELAAGSIAIPDAPTAPIYIDLKGELSLQNALAIPVKESGDTAYFPVIRVTAVPSGKEDDDTKATLKLPDGKAVTLPEIKKDKVNGNEKLSQIILAPNDSKIEIHGGTKDASSLSLTTNNKGAHIIKIEENGIVALCGKIKLNTGSIDKGDDRGSAVYIGKNGTLVFAGQTVIEKGNIAVEGTKIVFSISDEDGIILTWDGGGFIGDHSPEVTLDSQDITKKYGTEGLEEKLKEKLKTIKLISLKGNGEAANIVKKLENITLGGGALKISEDVLKDAIKTAAEGGVGEIAADDITVTSVDGDGDGDDAEDEDGESGLKSIVPDVDWSRISTGLRKGIENAIKVAEDERSAIGGALADLALNKELEGNDKKIAVNLLSKGTTEEKARMTLQIVESVRDVLYSKLNKESEGPYRNIWASVFGDVARNNVDGYKMNCDIYGFVVGGDVRINDTWTAGILGGHGKAKAKYKGDWFFSNTSNRCDHKSYFGGVYSMWDDLITDLNLKFSLLAGHCDYDESLGYLDFVDFNKVSQSNSHKGFFVSGNIDATYQHWNVWGLDFGPWLSIAVTNVHHRAHGDVIGQVKEEEEVSHDIKKMIGSANRRAVETILGVAASYDLTSNGILTFNLGYKHDFRRLKGGDAELLSSNEKEVIKYDLKNVRSGRDSFVAKADINMQFGQFGLSIGGHGQIGNHFKDIAGSITASYSF